MKSFRWDGHGNAILSKVAEFYRREVNTDCSFIVEDNKLRGHKVVLCASSNYFQEMFKNKLTEDEIRLKNVSLQDLKWIFNFLYFGEVEIPENQVESFMKTAELLQVKELLRVNEPLKASNIGSEEDNLPQASGTTCDGNKDRAIQLETPETVDSTLNEELRSVQERARHEDFKDEMDLERGNEESLKESGDEGRELCSLEEGAESFAKRNNRQSPKKKKRRPFRKETFTCSYCSYITCHKSHLNVHLRTHTKERPFSCNECDASFSHKVSLQIHQHKHTGERPYKCDVCTSSFSQLCSLKTHKRIHSGDKRYLCDVCSSSFTDYSNLKTHKRMHTGDKPYLCDICSSSFTRLSSLKIHKRIHTGDKPYLCDVCSSSFSRLSNLKTHKRIHTGAKPYVCDVCSSSFSQLGTLKRHKRIHSAEGSSDLYSCNENV